MVLKSLLWHRKMVAVKKKKKKLKDRSKKLNFFQFRFQTLSVLGQEQFSAALPQRAPVRWRHNTPLNTVVMFVPQHEAWVVERMGKFHRVLEPGVNVLAPLLDRVKYVQSLKEIAIDIPQQSAITIGEQLLKLVEALMTFIGSVIFDDFDHVLT